jgi:hypothetical protein
MVSIVDTLGSMAGGPLLAALFQEGSQRGGIWTGLPYHLIAVLFVFITILTFVIGARERDPKGAAVIGENEADPPTPTEQ